MRRKRYKATDPLPDEPKTLAEEMADDIMITLRGILHARIDDVVNRIVEGEDVGVKDIQLTSEEVAQVIIERLMRPWSNVIQLRRTT